MADISYERQRIVSSSSLDTKNCLSIWHTFRYLQDNSTECFQKLKCDGIEFKKLGAMWVFTKTRIKFFKIPFWMDKIVLKTFPSLNSGIRTNVSTEYRDEKGELLIAANQEMCVLDIEKHRPVKLTTLPYPSEGFPTPVFTENFEKFELPPESYQCVYKQKVLSQMLDMNFHLNNTEYVRLSMNCFDNDFLVTHQPDTLEVHYIAESQEGKMLSICKAEKNGKFFFKIYQEDKIVFEMMISFK
ncbi:MAG: acyl-[acyl-carrier-protein] thioesterase [Treponemataceae bacterium]